MDSLTAVDGIGAAGTSKLLAGNRPRLCPICGSVGTSVADLRGRTWDVCR
jgi:hypothetical protein